ncbi:DUF483 domain-containing protein [Candidatus Woesearchaeota archaeon]|nr:DUF483 domain-containing protein [Candidatus Woesearchaeota archaeon]
MYEFFPNHFYEFIGVDLGIKPSSFIIVPKYKLPFLEYLFNKYGYCYSILDSGDCNSYFRSLFDSDDNLEYSSKRIVCFSRDQNNLNQLIQILSLQTNLDPYEILNYHKSLGEILGYPKCCVNAFIETFGNFDAQTIFSANTFSKLKIIGSSSTVKINSLLNDLGKRWLQNYYVCSYNCKQSISQMKKIDEYMKTKHKNLYNYFSYYSKLPILILDGCFKFYFNKINIAGLRYNYSLVDVDGFSNSSNKIFELLEFFNKGNSFEISNNKIRIFRNADLLYEFVFNSYKVILIESGVDSQ